MGSPVFIARRYYLWKALDLAELDRYGHAGAFVTKAKGQPLPDPFPDDFPGRAQLLEARIPFVGWEDLIGASARDLRRACPALDLKLAQRIVAKVAELDA